MARKFLVALDLAKNELQNAVIQNLASAPGTPVKGQKYFDTTLNQEGYYNGSAWVYPAATGGGGTVTSVSVVTANGLAGTVATPTSTPAITLTTGVTGVLKGNGTAISAATSGTDYSAGTSALATGIVKSTTTTGALSIAASGTDYAPATATTSSLKGNGSGGFAVATLNDNATPTANYSMGNFKLTSVADPTLAQDAATKAYVDAFSNGITWKAAVRATTTVTGTLASAYANGSIIDGVTLATGDRILLKDQSTGSENGIYTVNASGAPTRATDADTSAKVPDNLAVFVEEGTTNADTGWTLTNNGAIVLGTTALVFAQFTGLGQVTAGTGLAKSGNTLSIENSGVLLPTHGGTGVATITGLVKGNGTSAFTTAAAGTDYAAATSGTNVLKGNGSGGFSSAKFTATIGDGSTTAIAVTHSLGTQDVIAQVRDASTNAVVECDVVQTSTSVTTFTFATAPATNAYKVVIIG